MRKILFGVLVAFASMQAARAEDWVVEAHYPDQAALQRASRHFEHVILDKTRNVLRVDTNEAGIDALEAEGLTVTIDRPRPARSCSAFYSTGARWPRSHGLGTELHSRLRVLPHGRRDLPDDGRPRVGLSGYRGHRRHRSDLEEDPGSDARLRDARDAHHELRYARGRSRPSEDGRAISRSTRANTRRPRSARASPNGSSTITAPIPRRPGSSITTIST